VILDRVCTLQTPVFLIWGQVASMRCSGNQVVFMCYFLCGRATILAIYYLGKHMLDSRHFEKMLTCCFIYIYIFENNAYNLSIFQRLEVAITKTTTVSVAVAVTVASPLAMTWVFSKGGCSGRGCSE